MGFTVASRGTALQPTPARPKAALAPLGKSWKGWTAPGVREVVKAVTADGKWLFERAQDGTWATGYLPTKTVVKERLRSLPACRRYAGSGKAREDLKRIQAALRRTD